MNTPSARKGGGPNERGGEGAATRAAKMALSPCQVHPRASLFHTCTAGGLYGQLVDVGFVLVHPPQRGHMRSAWTRRLDMNHDKNVNRRAAFLMLCQEAA